MCMAKDQMALEPAESHFSTSTAHAIKFLAAGVYEAVAQIRSRRRTTLLSEKRWMVTGQERQWLNDLRRRRIMKNRMASATSRSLFSHPAAADCTSTRKRESIVSVTTALYFKAGGMLRYRARTISVRTPRGIFSFARSFVLIKVNWNSVSFGGLPPITLKLARSAGEIMRELSPYGPESLPQLKFYM